MKETVLASRRQILAAFAGVGAILAERNSAPEPGDDSANVFFESDGARVVGQQYLELRPDESDSELLMERILAHADETPESFARLPLADRRMLLGKLCREDFANGRTVMVHNWVLAETEARISALSAVAAT